MSEHDCTYVCVEGTVFSREMRVQRCGGTCRLNGVGQMCAIAIVDARRVVGLATVSCVQLLLSRARGKLRRIGG